MVSRCASHRLLLSSISVIRKASVGDSAPVRAAASPPIRVGSGVSVLTLLENSGLRVLSVYRTLWGLSILQMVEMETRFPLSRARLVRAWKTERFRSRHHPFEA